MISQKSELLFNTLSYNCRSRPLSSLVRHIKLFKDKFGNYGAGINKIIVKVYSASLNPVDLSIYNARWVKVLSPYTQYFGRDYSGIIESIGEYAIKETGLKVGDKVNGTIYGILGLGSVAEYLEFDIRKRNFSISLFPENQSFSEAAAWPLVFGTAYQMVTNRLTESCKILVIGGGTSVGRLVIQLSKILGTKNIVATCSPQSESTIRKLGATSIIDYTKQDSILNDVLESSKDRFFDYIFDCVGNNDLFGNMTSILKPNNGNSEYITIVGDMVLDFDSFNLLPLIKMLPMLTGRKVFSILGLSPYKYTVHIFKYDNDWIVEGKKLFEKSKVEIAIDSIYKLENYHEAVNKLATHKAKGKVVIQIREEN